MTRVVLIGNFSVGYTTETFLARAFRENGCEVTEVSQDDAFHMGAEAFADLVVTGALSEPRVSLVCYTRTHNRTALGPEWTNAWNRLRRAGITSCSVHLDRFFGLSREHLIYDGDPLFTTDRVFTADGGSQKLFESAGVCHVYLPPAVDRTEAQWEGVKRPELSRDVIFVGSSERTYHEQYQGRRLLLEHLRRTYGPRFRHYGHGGDHPVVRQQALNDAVCSASVVIGDSCFANEKGSPRSAFYISDRAPELIGRGAFMIHPYVPGVIGNGPFLSGVHLLTHAPGDFEDLDQQIGYAMANPGLRDGIAETGRAFVLREHTYTHRAAEILRVVGLEVSEPARQS